MKHLKKITHFFVILPILLHTYVLAIDQQTPAIRIPILNDKGDFLSSIFNEKLTRLNLSTFKKHYYFELNSSSKFYWNLHAQVEKANLALGTKEEITGTHPKHFPGLCYMGEAALIPFIFMNLKDNFLSDQLVVYAFKVNGQKWFSEFETEIENKVQSSYPLNWRTQNQPDLNGRNEVSIIFAISDDQEERDEVTLKKCY